jgi:hypothetical protein
MILVSRSRHGPCSCLHEPADQKTSCYCLPRSLSLARRHCNSPYFLRVSKSYTLGTEVFGALRFEKDATLAATKLPKNKTAKRYAENGKSSCGTNLVWVEAGPNDIRSCFKPSPGACFSPRVLLNPAPSLCPAAVVSGKDMLGIGDGNVKDQFKIFSRSLPLTS